MICPLCGCEDCGQLDVCTICGIEGGTKCCIDFLCNECDEKELEDEDECC